MQEEFGELGLEIIGITDAGRTEAQEFASDQELNFPLVADAPRTREAFGIKMIWGSVVFLVGPDGVIRAESLDDAEERLEEELL